MLVLEKKALFASEAKVIAENATHAVITLRIPKCWITRNIGFLAAIVDIVLTRRAKPLS